MAKEPKTLDELFHETLKDIYVAEKKILMTLPKMAKAAQSEELKAAFDRFALVAETHKRFGRGLGKGMCGGTLAAICRVSCVDGPTAGLTGKAAIGSLDADLRTACDL